ncbi:MAG: hypothetical protein AMJ77_04690 [Dehalococcoidia bacterium SM23_28_2]|nr:MAG: hypothetical protein AMJ77_04690 [Dehalococcoidia bacterium SM23_28_2]
MELSTKVKELEDELKVLKAEIRNVLLDIREVILDGSNPLADQQEPAYLRMDLTTTARTMAAEEAARAARDALEQAKGQQDTEDKAEEPKAEEAREEEKAEEETEDEPEESEVEEAPEQVEGEEDTEGEAEEPEAEETPEEIEGEEDKLGEPEASDEAGEPPPNGKAFRRARTRPEALLEGMQIPPAYFASLLPTGAASGLAAWATEAMATIGPQDLERVITIHRLWGSLPPNISYALAHLQRLIRSSREREPAWLKVMQDMEKLASSS